jgi:uncharacterized cupredoxin-like copper-binding protein
MRPSFWKMSLFLLLGGVVGLGAAGYTFAARAENADDNERTVIFRFSHFATGDMTVRAGVPITFTLDNEDPIEHEWIIGNEEVHERHRNGTEAYHDQVPSEVTVPALSVRNTTLTFLDPGDYDFICHLPGHEAYGMRATLHVLPSDR